jgi:hypothetical protein
MRNLLRMNRKYKSFKSTVVHFKITANNFSSKDQLKLGVAIRVHGAGSCRVGWYNSTIWVNLNTTRLLIVLWYVNPNMTCLLNELTRHDSHNPFNKQVGLGWHNPTQPIWLELYKMTCTTHLTQITQIDLFNKSCTTI